MLYLGLFVLAQKVRGHFSVNPPVVGEVKNRRRHLGEMTPPAQH